MSTNNERHIAKMYRVADCLMHGKDQAIERREICERTGINDRQVREIIEDFRNKGLMVCNDQDGKGYYVACTDDEVLRQYKRDCRRAMSILRRLKTFRWEVRMIQQKEENKDQITIEEILGLMEGKI